MRTYRRYPIKSAKIPANRGEKKVVIADRNAPISTPGHMVSKFKLNVETISPSEIMLAKPPPIKPITAEINLVLMVPCIMS